MTAAPRAGFEPPRLPTVRAVRRDCLEHKLPEGHNRVAKNEDGDHEEEQRNQPVERRLVGHRIVRLRGTPAQAGVAGSVGGGSQAADNHTMSPC
jgi:hypothetical protein